MTYPPSIFRLLFSEAYWVFSKRFPDLIRILYVSHGEAWRRRLFEAGTWVLLGMSERPSHSARMECEGR
jgi:hypothetical protein